MRLNQRPKRIWILASPLLMVISGLQAASKFDPPDLNFEYRLHRQYLNSQSPLQINPAHQKENIDLRRGDTLKSLSQTLYGDSSYWPGIWSQSNSSLVRPGHSLQFILGSEDNTPAFRFSEQGDQGPGGAEFAASTSGNPIVEIPPPESPPRPVLKIPPSFPEWQSVYQRPTEMILDDRNLGKVQDKIPDRIWLTSYVQEAPLDPIGSFLETDMDAGLPLANQYVFIKVKKGAVQVGQKLLVAKDLGLVKRINKQWSGDEDAYLIQLFAELEVTESMPAKFVRKIDADTFDTFRAIVTRSTGLSVRNSSLIMGSLKTVNLDIKGPRGTTVAQIIGAEKHEASMLYGPGEIVFLNKGSQSGLEEGQLLDVFIDRTIRQPGTPVVHSPAPSGTVKVVKVTPKLATAVLLVARDGIQQGDEVREMSSRTDIEGKFDESSGIDDDLDSFERSDDSLEPLDEDVEEESEEF